MSNPTLLEKCCLIGNPVAGNPTHYMIERALREADSDWRFLTFEVLPEQLGDAMRGIRALGIKGAKIIKPHREPVMEFVDDFSNYARLANSANCITNRDGRLLADNTLGRALLASLGDKQPGHAWVLGAGLTARAISTALAISGVPRITISNRSAEAGEQLCSTINDQTSSTADFVSWPTEKLLIAAEIDLFVNATKLGTVAEKESLEIDDVSLRADLAVADIGYTPPHTPLVVAAREKECQTIDGLSLLVEQTAQALQTWSGIEANRESLREAAEEFLDD